MDFAFSPDQQLLKNSARAFLDEHCKPAHRAAPCSTTRAARARRSGRRWPSSAGSASRCPRSTAAAGSAWSRRRILLDELGRAAYPGPVPARPCWLATAIAGRRQRRRRRSAGCPPSPPASARATAGAARARARLGSRRRRPRGPSAAASGWVLTGPEALRALGRTWPTRCSCRRARPRDCRSSSSIRLRPRARAVAHDDRHRSRHAAGPGHARRRGRSAPTPCWARPARPARCSRTSCAAAAVGAAAEMLGAARRCLDMASATPRCASSSASPSARSRPSATSARRCCWRSRTRTPPSYYAAWALDAGRRGRRAGGLGRPRPTWATPRARCAARPSRCTAASASPGSTTSTSTSSAPRRSRSLYGDADYHRELVLRAAAA